MALNREQVLTEALHLLDEKGLEGLSLRTLAGRLGVQAPTLYWHVENKAALLDALSDAIMQEALAELPALDSAHSWQEWMLGALKALRDAMIAHRDGARVVSGAHDSLLRAEFTELAMARLIDGGVDPRRAWVIVLAATRYTLGHVLAEQGPDAAPSAELEAEFQRRFPLLASGVADYFGSHDADDLFTDAVRQLIGGE